MQDNKEWTRENDDRESIWNIPEKFRFSFIFLFNVFFLIGNFLVIQHKIYQVCSDGLPIDNIIKDIGSVGLSSAILTFSILGVIEILGTTWDKLRKSQFREGEAKGRREELDRMKKFALDNGETISREELLKFIEKEED